MNLNTIQVPTIDFGNRSVGVGNPVYLIAEIGLNHQGDLNVAFELINHSKRAGFDAVKFQKRTLDEIYTKKVLDDPNTYEEGFRYLIPILKESEFGKESYDKIVDYCKSINIDFICTPFDESAVDFLSEYDLKAFKVASADFTNLILLEKIISQKKPIILSTGMSTYEEMDIVTEFLFKNKANFSILHAVSAYPTPLGDSELNVITQLKQRYGVPVGLSSHEIGIEVSMASVALGVSIIERHVTLDKRMEGPDHSASLDPNQMLKFVEGVRNIELAMGGKEKHISRIVVRNIETLSKSLVAKNTIKQGSVITRNDVTVKGPAKGVTPLKLYSLLGKVAKRNFEKDDFFSESDFAENSTLEDYKPKFKSKWGFKGRFQDLDYYNEKYSPRFVEIHLNDKDLDFDFKEHFGNRTFPFNIILHYPTYWQRKVVDLACENESDRKLFVEVVQRVINMAFDIKDHFIGTPGVVVHMGGMDIVEKKENSKLIKLAYKSMKELDSTGVIFYAENNPPRPWYFSGQWYDNAFCSPYEMVDFCKEFNVPMCFDFSHAKLYCNLTGFDYYKYIEIVAPVTKHLHICDAYGIDGEGMQIGEGDIDFVKALDVLREFGDVENMSWTPEIWQGHNNNAAGFIEGFLRLDNLNVLS